MAGLRMFLYFHPVFSFLQLYFFLFAVYEEGDFTGLLGGEGEGGDAVVLPGHANGDAATGTDAADTAVFPILRQSGK